MSSAYPSDGAREDLVRMTEGLIPVIQARAAETDALRQLPAQTAWGH
jgi:hypothetical protein